MLIEPIKCKYVPSSAFFQPARSERLPSGFGALILRE
jgi:hypothetical protein